jgi:hypothetical protein
MNMRPETYLMRALFLGAFTLLLWAPQVQAQKVTEDPDWKETEVPAPPTFSLDKLLPLDMPPYVNLQFGIDPATLALSSDGVVRYVVVARNASGSANAMYEGIRCTKGEVKTYARTNSSGTWVALSNPQWRGLSDNQPSKHAQVFARQGACDAYTPANSVADIIKGLKK